MYGIKQAKKKQDKLTQKSLDRFLILYNSRQIYLSLHLKKMPITGARNMEVEGEWKMDEPQPKSPIVQYSLLPCHACFRLLHVP